MGEAFTIEEDAFQEHHHQHTHTYYDATAQTDLLGDLTVDRQAFRSNYEQTRETSGISHGTIVAADLSTPARIDTETRPKNIKVVYIMKCWHIGQE